MEDRTRILGYSTSIADPARRLTVREVPELMSPRWVGVPAVEFVHQLPSARSVAGYLGASGGPLSDVKMNVARHRQR